MHAELINDAPRTYFLHVYLFHAISIRHCMNLLFSLLNNYNFLSHCFEELIEHGHWDPAVLAAELRVVVHHQLSQGDKERSVGIELRSLRFTEEEQTSSLRYQVFLLQHFGAPEQKERRTQVI